MRGTVRCVSEWSRAPELGGVRLSCDHSERTTSMQDAGLLLKLCSISTFSIVTIHRRRQISPTRQPMSYCTRQLATPTFHESRQ